VTEPVWPAPAPGTRWLFRLPNWIGDAVMVLPALRALPRDGQTRLGVAHPRVLDLYRASGLLDDLWPAEGWRAPGALARRLRAWKPDRAVVFTEALSGAVLARASGADRRLGPRRAGTRSLFTQAVAAPGREAPLWRRYAALARGAGAARVQADFRLEAGSDAVRRAGELLRDCGADPVALAPGATYGPAKQWPLESAAALCETLRSRGTPVVVVGGAAEKPLGAALSEHGARDLTGGTGLLDAVALFARCRAVVTNDSGALHLARAAGTPVVAIFGSTSPLWTGPEPEDGETLWLGLLCSPCFRRRCRFRGEDELRCLREIGVDAVLAALDRTARGVS